MVQFEGFRCPHEVRQGSYAHLPHEVTSMDLDGDFAEPEFSRCLFIHQARGDKRHDLPFARRERLEPPAEFGKLLADETVKWAKVVKFANISVE